MIEQVIDRLIKTNGDHRAAMAWLIGRMDSAERSLEAVKRTLYCKTTPTTLERIEARLKGEGDE